MFKIPSDEINKYIAIEKERNEEMKAISLLLGADFTFSEEEIIANAEEQFTKAIQKKVESEVEKWMKSVF
mgnify:CR=1 FL=1|tara:strand:+ start:140 stop:349 length:210 start_codon:yes stop_codon:yes gene_type:complete